MIFKDIHVWVNYHHLYYFKTIAEEQSVSKAAEKLRLGQPTLSAQLKQFEDQLGVKLFDRQHKKLILTDQGKIALSYAQTIFKLGFEMVDALQDRIQPEKIKLQIGSVDSVSKLILADIADICFQKNPVQISFIEGPIDFLLRELDSHNLDIVIVNHLPLFRENRKNFSRLVFKDEVKVYGAIEFKNLKKKFPESLMNQRVILPTIHTKLRDDLEHFFSLNKISMDIIAESQDLALKEQLALKGLGLIACSEKTVRHHVQFDRLVELGTLKNVFEEIYFISTERKVTNPIAQYLMKEYLVQS